MANWYMKGQSDYLVGGFHMGFYIDHSGFAEGDYDTQDMETHGATSDPFMAFGIDTGPATWTYGQQQVEIGLLKSHRLKFDTTGSYKWVGPGQDDWALLEVAGSAGNLGDLDDVVIDGTPANNELLAYDTTTSKWINQTGTQAGLALSSELHTEDHDNTHHTTNYEVANANIQSHVTVSHEPANANIQSHVGGTPPTSAHHVKTVKYTAGEVDARIVVQNTHPAGTIDIAVDALIATHVTAGHTLNQINNPSGDKEFNFANKHLHFTWVAPASGAHEGAFEIEASGAFSGDLIHIHQHTGVVGAGTYMVFVECEHANASCMHLVHGGNVFDFGANGLLIGADARITEFDTSPLALSDTKVPTNTTVIDYVTANSITTAQAIQAVEDTGLVLSATKVITTADEDLTFSFGMAALGLNAGTSADDAQFSHRAMNDQESYALNHSRIGRTRLNAAASREIMFTIQNLEIGQIDANGLQLGGANARVTTILDEDAMGTNSATALATQQSIKKYVDDNLITTEQAVQAVEDAGLTLSAAQVITSPDADTEHILGRTHIGDATGTNADYMVLAHRDMMDQEGYAIKQSPIGNTFVNADGSREVFLCVQNLERGNYSSLGLQLGGANARVTTIYDEDAMGSNSATALCTQQSIKAYADGKGADKTRSIKMELIENNGGTRGSYGILCTNDGEGASASIKLPSNCDTGSDVTVVFTIKAEYTTNAHKRWVDVASTDDSETVTWNVLNASAANQGTTNLMFSLITYTITAANLTAGDNILFLLRVNGSLGAFYVINAYLQYEVT